LHGSNAWQVCLHLSDSLPCEHVSISHDGGSLNPQTEYIAQASHLELCSQPGRNDSSCPSRPDEDRGWSLLLRCPGQPLGDPVWVVPYVRAAVDQEDLTCSVADPRPLGHDEELLS